MEETRDPYLILDLPRSALAESVKASYRRLSKQYHPDAPSGGDAVKMADINWAWNILSDADKRKAYDDTGNTEFSKISDPVIREAYNILAGLGTMIFTSNGMADSVFFTADIKATLELHLNTQLDDHLNDLKTYQDNLSRARLRRKSIVREPAHQVFTGVIEQFIRQNTNAIKKAEDKMAYLNKALELLSEFEFWTPAMGQPPATQYYRLSN